MDARQMFLQMCEERRVEAQESIIAQLQRGRGTHSSRLEITHVTVSNSSCDVLARVLQTYGTFEEVSLSYCTFTKEGAKMLLRGFFSNTTVKVLDLRGTGLESSEAEVLGELLTRNKTLSRLMLEWNSLGRFEESFSIFCHGLASNTTLFHLDLRKNQINHNGTVHLARALKHNSTLKELDLGLNNIGVLGGKPLLEALKENKSIILLELAGGNNIPFYILKALDECTEHNRVQQSTCRHSSKKTHVLNKDTELKQDKSQQFLSLMETIDRQREEIVRVKRSASSQIRHLQEALKKRTAEFNTLTAKLQRTEAALTVSEHEKQSAVQQLSRMKAQNEEQKETPSIPQKKEGERLRSNDHLGDAEIHGKLRELEEKVNFLYKVKSFGGRDQRF